jgi:cytochrome c
MNSPSKTVLLLSLTALLAAAPLAYAADGQPAPTQAISAIERGHASQASALLERAAQYLKSNGPEHAFAVFNDRQGTFASGEHYVFAVGLDGILYASNGASRALVGLNVRELKDAAGTPFIRQMLDMAKTSAAGEVDYRWLNSADNRVENTVSRFQKVGDYLVVVGYYAPRASAEEAQAMLKKAVALLKKSGGEAAFAAFNDPQGGYVVNDEYVFAIGLEDGTYRASGASPNLVGVDVREVTDAAGKPLFKDMIALAKQKGSGTLDYSWRNPATNAVEHKRSLIQRVDDVLLGVGYYAKP